MDVCRPLYIWLMPEQQHPQNTSLEFFPCASEFYCFTCNLREGVYKWYTHMFPSLHYILHLISRALLFWPFVIFDASLAGWAGIIPYSSVVATHRDSRKLELVAASHLSQTRFSLFGPLLIFTLNLQHGFIPGPQQCLPLQERQTCRAPTGFMFWILFILVTGWESESLDLLERSPLAVVLYISVHAIQLFFLVVIWSVWSRPSLGSLLLEAHCAAPCTAASPWRVPSLHRNSGMPWPAPRSAWKCPWRHEKRPASAAAFRGTVPPSSVSWRKKLLSKRQSFNRISAVW